MMKDVIDRVELPVEGAASQRHPKDLRLIYIVGSGHCGSTLLNLLLNAHDDVIGLSEVYKINRCIRNPSESGYLIGNGRVALDKNDFWQRVLARYERDFGESAVKLQLKCPSKPTALVRWVVRGAEKWGRRNEMLFSSVAREARVGVLVDASKQWQRLLLLRRHTELDIRVIHLVRDGRAVAYSHYRKGRSLAWGIGAWRRRVMGTLIARPFFSRSQWMTLRYEDLCRSPEGALRQVCAHAGIEFDPHMLERWRDVDHNGISGNRMRRKRNDTSIELDEVWRSRLSTADFRRFALRAAWLNRIYGYRN